MVEVRVRHEYSPTAVKLGEVELTQTGVASAIELLKHWGFIWTGEMDTNDDLELSGQFVFNDNSSFFEIILHPSDQ